MEKKYIKRGWVRGGGIDVRGKGTRKEKRRERGGEGLGRRDMKRDRGGI